LLEEKDKLQHKFQVNIAEKKGLAIKLEEKNIELESLKEKNNQLTG
jgi:predicted nuclease with TOPRIM domain